MPDNDDKLLAALTRQVSSPPDNSMHPATFAHHQDRDDAGFTPPSPDEPLPPSPGFDDYSAALNTARQKITAFERAFAANKKRKKALSRLPFPWVQPILRLGLWSTALVLAFFAAPDNANWYQPTTLPPVLFIALSLFCGEGAGRATSAFITASDWLFRLLQVGAATFFTVLATLTCVVLFHGTSQTFPFWFSVAAPAIALVAAFTLPWFGTSRKEYTKLLSLVESSTRRQNEARRKAQLAVDKLLAIHAKHLRDIPTSLKRPT